MMKTISISVLLIVISIQLNSQDFAPIGSKWYYTALFDYSRDTSYFLIESKKDTIIKGKPCHVLESNDFNDCSFSFKRCFIFSENNIVYFYIPEIDTFQTLYNFNVVQDSSWKIVFNEFSLFDTLLVTVNSISSIMINGNSLKKFNVTYKPVNFFSCKTWPSYNSEIIERIGDVNYLFNLRYTCAYCDFYRYSIGLRCYQDSALGYYSTGIADSCNYTHKWTSIKENSIWKNFEVFPNPTNGLIKINVNSNNITSLVINNLLGNIICARDFISKAQIDISKYQNGIYFMTLRDKEKVICVKKIIKI